MLFQLSVNGTEEDYLAYSLFQAFETTYGKKQIRKVRVQLACLAMLVIGIVLYINGFSVYSFASCLIYGLYSALYILLFKKLRMRHTKREVKKLAKAGKLPFDPVSTYEFYEEKLVETTTTTRTEQSYSAIEQLCIVKDKYIFLCTNDFAAYVLPISQIREQLDYDALLSFLSQKCAAVEYY